MSDDKKKKKTTSFDDKMTAFSDRIEKALEKERKERAAESAAARKEFDAKMEKEHKKFRRELAVETGKLQDMWGKLAEFVVKSGILATLNQHGDLHIDEVLPDIPVRYQGEDGSLRHGQIDIIASGERDLVIIETKTTLQVSDIRYFLNRYLIDYPRWQASSSFVTLPKCDGKRLFGCMAYMKAEGEAEDVAAQEGLITVHVFGDSSSLAQPNTPLIDYHPDRYQRSK